MTSTAAAAAAAGRFRSATEAETCNSLNHGDGATRSVPKTWHWQTVTNANCPHEKKTKSNKYERYYEPESARNSVTAGHYTHAELTSGRAHVVVVVACTPAVNAN